jgi:hypothetical protein
MTGIEGYYKKPKPKKPPQIPANESGRQDAREADDEELDEYVREVVLSGIREELAEDKEEQETKKNTIKTQATTQHDTPTWIVTTQRVITNVYHIKGIANPKKAVDQAYEWEERGEEAAHTLESNVDQLTPNVIGVPGDDDGEYKSALINTPQKKQIDGEELDAAANAFDHIIKMIEGKDK